MNQLKLAFLCVLFANTLMAQDPSLDWAFASGSGSGPAFSHAIINDDEGNVYVAGQFSGTIDFDPGADSTILTSDGWTNVFVQKLDNSGNLIWVVSFGNSGTIVTDLALDDAGNIHLTGRFTGSPALDFDPGPETFNLPSSGSYEIYVLKLASNSNFIWAKSMGGSDADEALSMDLDPAGNVYITGSFEGTADFDPGPGESIHTCIYWTDIFVLKLDANGDFVWVNSMGNSEQNKGISIDIGTEGNVYLTGYFTGTVDFDSGDDTYILVAGNAIGTAQYKDIFIQKLDAEGNFIWANRMGAHITDEGKVISTDNAGNIYLTGRFSGIVDLDPGPDSLIFTSSQDVNHFIQKLDSDGNLLWVKPNVEANSLTMDFWGNLYLAGRFQDTEDLDPGMDSLNLTAVGSSDGFIQKLSPSGDLMWVVHLEGTQQIVPKSINVDEWGNVFATGLGMGTFDLDPGPDSLHFTFMPPGYFVLKLNQENVVTVEEINPISVVYFFPNPTKGEITLDMGSLVDPIVRVYNLAGELLQEINNIPTKTLNLSIEGSSGIYLVEIYSDKIARKTFKIIKN